MTLEQMEFVKKEKSDLSISMTKQMARTAWAGLMVGDALGAPVEFCHEYEIRRAYPEGVDRMLHGFGICIDRKAGEVTDDTQMAWCLHQALLDADGWDKYAAHKR